MTVNVGDAVPAATLRHMTASGIETVQSTELFQGKWVVFALPGAFTPTCSAKHLPGFVAHHQAFADKGYKIACLSVNDPFVMGAWGKDQNVGDAVLMLADGNGEFTKALGLELDASGAGLGIRSKRYGMAIVDGKITALNVEAPGAFEVSSAEAMLQVI